MTQPLRDLGRLWREVLERVDREARRRSVPFPLATWLVFSLPAYLAFGVFVVIRHERMQASLSDLVGVSIALSWSWVGANALHHYHSRLTPSFVARARHLVRGADPDLAGLVGIGARWAATLRIVWCAVVLGAFWAAKPMVDGLFGFRGYWDLFFVGAILGVLVLASLTAEGFVLVFNTFALVLQLLRCDLRVDPYAPDGLGGMGEFGRLTIATTGFFSSGALFVPALFSVVRKGSGFVMFGPLLLVALFSLLVLLSFVVPNFLVYRVAKGARDRDIGELAVDLNRGATEILHHQADETAMRRFELLRSHYEALRDTAVFPFNLGILVRLLSSVVFPLGLALVERFVVELLP